MKVRVGILSTADPKSGGIYQYTLSLLEAFSNYSSNKFEYIQIRLPNFPKILKEDIVINQDKNNIILKIKRLIFQQFGLKIGDILGSYNNPELKDVDLIISPVVAAMPLYMQKPFIMSIYDFQHKYYPSFFTIEERILREITFSVSKKANILICESSFVKRDIEKFLKIPEEKIRVITSPPPKYIQKINIGSQDVINVKRKYDLPERYIFYPAQFWFHKNHIKLLEALSLLRNKYNTIVSLILVGSKKNNFDNVMKAIEKLNLERQVKYLGYVPDEDMPYLYKLSTALVMPTLFESVSMPIWEAFYLGVPVVSSNVCALPEQVGNAGLLFDPFNIEDIAEKIYKIWIDENLRTELVQKGYNRIKDLTLENYAKQWEDVIEEVSRALYE
jgi:glycosyltransferase involved in cell wall biosynthesis